MSEGASRSPATRAVVIVAAIVLLTRVPALWISRGGFLFSVDELELVRSVVDRFVGVPSTTLAWPASLLQMIGVAAVAIGAVLVPVTSPAALADYLSRLYLDNSGLLALLRVTTTLAMTFAFALYFVRMRDTGKGNLFSASVTLVFATTPLALIYSTQATGDGLAFTLVLLSGLSLEGTRSARRETIAGACFGLALAAKFTAVLALPFILALLLGQRAKDRGSLQGMLAFVAAATLALGVACPYLWLDPVRLAKSVLGNAARGGDAMGLVSALWEFLVAISAPMAVLAVTGLASLAYQRRFGAVAGGVASLLVLVFVTATAGVVFDRYFLPGLAVAGLIGIHAPWPRRPGRFDTAFLSVGIVIYAFANGLGYWITLDEQRDEGNARTESVRALAALPDGIPILLPYHLLIAGPEIASSESLLRIADGIDRAMLEGASHRVLAGRVGMTKDVARILAPAFTEDELALAARLRAMAGETPRPRLDVHPWYRDGARFGILTKDEAIAIYRASKTQYLVAKGEGDCTDYLYLGREGKKLGRSCLYFPGDAPQGSVLSDKEPVGGS